MSSQKVIFVLAVLLAILGGLYFYIQIAQRQSEKFRIIFLNVGQGDAALIRFDGGQKMLVDCGIDRKILVKLGEYLPFYDRVIDYLLITHPDADHYGGCAEVLRRYNIKNIIWNGEIKDSDPYWAVWEKNFKAEGAGSIVVDHAQEMLIGNSNLKFLSPDDELGLEEKNRTGNNRSIVFLLEQTGSRYLMSGDMEIPLESALLQKYCLHTEFSCSALQADYLKVGHHGSDSSSDQAFLEAVNPQKAIISVGKNSFGHPSFRVLMKMRRQGVEVWRTDEKGDIILE